MSTSSRASTVGRGETMDASYILAHYLNLLRSDPSQLRFQMAQNCVLDWFGRSVRGPLQIHEYLRNEICAQYEHIDFEKVEDCEPIECKPSHQKTKTIVTGEVDYANPKNKVSGITSLKLYADSDLDDEEEQRDEHLDMLPGHRTPERTDNTIIEALTPPTSSTKPFCDSATATDEDEDDEFMEVKAKRLKRTHPSSPFSYLRRLPTTAAKTIKRKALKRNEIRTLADNSSSDEDGEQGSRKHEFTPLRYLQATGVLRAKDTQQKASSSLNAPAGNWDRQVRIRISYRQRVSDGELQLALVIYEHLDRVNKAQTRRNLMLEFSQAAEQQVGIDVNDAHASIDIVEEQPALVVNPEDGETVIATVATPSSEEIAAALETAAFTIVPLRTPTKNTHTPPPTPKRKARLPHAMSGLKRLNLSPSSSTPKRSAARSLRL